ncbi:hypothetical protein PV328_002041 [Microctonus aethiopoides]|uniref:Serine/threonine-protein kinase ATM n=1 Tax=Microctonus aethiopoides TaxID=144406 RepID=A0AA39KY58_9HYME|nr:hypothetical protein PV328_002041 [Microctonus aethiopoides]
MSSYSTSIHRIFLNKDLKKAGGKNKFLQNLLDVIDNDAARKEFTRNSESPSNENREHITWNTLFQKCHQFVLDETLKSTTKRSRVVIEQQGICCTLILNIVRYASSTSVVYVNFSSLRIAICEILESDRYLHYHDTYMKIFIDYILSIRLYRIQMLPEYWQKFLRICITLYENSEMNKDLLLKALQKIVHHSFLQSHLLHEIKTILPFLTGVIDDVTRDPALLSKLAYKFIYTVCEQIGTECRTALCELSENIIPKFINMEDSPEKYKLLYLFVLIHHPNGALSSDATAYAHDWTEWKQIMLSIYKNIRKDIKNGILLPNFIQLASEICKQIIDDPVYYADELNSTSTESFPRAKRRKLSAVIQKPIDLFTMQSSDDNIECQWAIIEILTDMFDKYPDMLTLNDFVPLIKIVSDLFSGTNVNDDIVDSLCKLCTILIKIENNLSCHSMPLETTKKYWNKIWYTLVKILGLGKNQIEGHRLLQLLIENLGELSINTLLGLYTTNEMPWSSYSIRTLYIICQNATIPDFIGENTMKQEDLVKVRLLHWAINISTFKTISPDTVTLLCEIITNLTLKSWNKKNYQSSKTNTSIKRELFTNNSEYKCLNDITRCNLSLEFAEDLFVDDDTIPKPDSSRKPAKPLFSENILKFAFERLHKSIQFDERNKSDIDRVIYNLIIVAKCISNLLELNMESNDKRLKILQDAFEDTFKNLNAFITCEKLINRKNNHIINLIRGLATLYETSYHNIIADSIVQLSSREVLLALFDVFNFVNDSESSELNDFGIKYYEDIFELRDRSREQLRDKRTWHYLEISNDSVITIGAFRVLTSFGCVDAGKETYPMQTKALTNFLQVKIYAPTVIGNLWQGLVLIKTLATCRKGFISPSLMKTITTFIDELFQLWKNDGNGIIGIIEFVPYFLEHVIHVGGNTSKILRILEQSNELLQKNKYGPPVHVNFFKCWHKVIQLLSSLNTMKNNISLIDMITTIGIKNPFYIARLEAVRIVHFIFASDDFDVTMKKKLFVDIEKIIFNSFINNSAFTGLVAKDEWNTKAATALYTFGGIIHASGLFQKKALISIFELFAVKDIPINSIIKILRLIIKNDTNRMRLIDSSLPSLLMRWVKNNASMKQFPWMLTQATSEENFYRKYIGSLIHIKLETNQLSDMVDICNDLQCQFSQMINDNFPSIITWLLAQISNTTNKSYQYATEIFARLKNNHDEFEHVYRFNSSIEDNLADILINLFERLHDENHFLQMFDTSVVLPRMDLLNLNHSTIEKIFKLLKNCLSTANDSLVHFILVKNPSVIQKTLLTLSSRIYQFDMAEYKHKALHQYASFCDLLKHEISYSFFDKMAMFVVRDVCYTLTHLIQNETNSVSTIAAKYLFQFIEKTLSSRSEEISDILNFLVKKLISIIQSNKMDNTTLQEILKFLIVDSTEILTEAIRKLDALPTHSLFDEIRCIHESLKNTSNNDNSLRNEIEHFLNTGSDVNTMECSFEGLLHLKQILFERKLELNEMYRDLEKLRGFAEDCTSSILHKLIYRLVKLTEHLDSNISLEAAQCLGELGPADLTTMILHREKSFCSITKRDQYELILTYRIAVQLADFIVGSDDNLRQASSNALCEICASCWGREILTKKYLQNFEDSGKQMLLEYIQPFLSNGKLKIRTILFDNDNYLKCFDRCNEIWCGDKVDCYTTWITNITCSILDCMVNFYSSCLKPICKLNTEFCEMILPYLICIIISADEYMASEVYNCINQFFNKYFDSSIKLQNTIYSNEQKKMGCFSHESVKCMLNIVNFIRIQSDNDLALKLNYLHIAKAAQYCSAYFTSVLYAELFCQIKLQQTYRSDGISIIDHIYETHPNEGKSLQHILREAFVQIGEPDSIHGCGLSHLKDPKSRMQHYIHVQQWDKVMISQDVELSSGCPLTSDLAKALRHSGLDYLLNRFISTVKDVENVTEYVYETAWRLSDWNIISNRQPSTIEHADLFNIINNNDYDFYHYQALKYLHANDNVAVKESIDMARASIIKSLRNASLECSQTLYPKLLKLQMLRELEQLSISKSDEWPSVISHWSQQDLTNINDFTYIEPILAQRIVMCGVKYSTSGSLIMKDAFINLYLELSKCAEQQGYPHIAARSLALLSKERNLPDDVMMQLQYHDALLAWARNDHDIGRYLLRDLINKRELNDNFKARALTIYGNWMAETKSENPQCVIEKYYSKSIELSNNSNDDGNNLNDTYAALAQFADAQYQQINTYMKTPIFESLKECAEYRHNEKPVKLPKSLPKEEEHALKSHKAQDTIDVAEYKNTQSDQKMYLLLAVQNYLMTLQTGDNHNFLIFRLVSLWLNNTDNNDLNKLFVVHLNNIPTFKFIPLMPQLAPHITNITNANQFKMQIYDLVKRCAEDHPHHTLPILFALMNNYADYEYNKMSQPEATERELGAKKLINQLNKSELSPIITEMNSIANALIMFAYLSFNAKPQFNSIPLNQKIWKIKNFQHSLLPTITLDIRPSGDYKDIVSVYKYDHHFEGVGGVNAPKKIICIGTDGIERKQLIKGKDDLRQDAVMQQVFTIINLLLCTRKETRRRKLNIRTYKIVPLSQRSGVLEWCDNTLPISCILCGTSDTVGMHTKYHPQDLSFFDCKKKIQAAKSLSNNEKLKVYLECCEKLRPAFQYFFMEKFPSPEMWFERRLAYVRSVATTSMVGYIIGLGDRHFSNILIDQTTAEVIHIDFGIAFEQGKVLPIPETVPFRLTRDMEAAMGISGVEGVMRKSCEETMTVLRNRREIIITLLQVLLYAPLFSWTITPAKAWELQNERRRSSHDDTSRGDDNINKIAERALLRIEQKLQGTEDGLVTSISGQVERLIQEARDPVNLSKLFCGWQAYL